MKDATYIPSSWLQWEINQAWTRRETEILLHTLQSMDSKEKALNPCHTPVRLSQSIKLRTERKVLVEFWINLSLDIGAMILGKLNDYVLRIQPPEASFFCSKLA